MTGISLNESPIEAAYDVNVEIYLNPVRGVVIAHVRATGDDPAFLTPSQAREVARRLNAAAAQAESEEA
jgi:hypothetical protein